MAAAGYSIPNNRVTLSLHGLHISIPFVLRELNMGLNFHMTSYRYRLVIRDSSMTHPYRKQLTPHAAQTKGRLPRSTFQA